MSTSCDYYNAGYTTRWILSEYSRTSSVTALLSNLKIPTLEQHRQSSGLTLFYKIINNLLPTYHSSILLPSLNSIQDNIIETTLSCCKPH